MKSNMDRELSPMYTLTHFWYPSHSYPISFHHSSRALTPFFLLVLPQNCLLPNGIAFTSKSPQSLAKPIFIEDGQSSNAQAPSSLKQLKDQFTNSQGPPPQRKSLSIFSILKLTFLKMINRDKKQIDTLERVFFYQSQHSYLR